MGDSKVLLFGLRLIPEYLDDKSKFEKDVEYTIREYVKKFGKRPVQITMNYPTSVKVKEIMKVVDDELVSICGLEPNYNYVMRDDFVFVSDGSM